MDPPPPLSQTQRIVNSASIGTYNYEPVISMTDYLSKGLRRYQSNSKGASGAPPEVAGRKTNSTERGTLRRDGAMEAREAGEEVGLASDNRNERR